MDYDFNILYYINMYKKWWKRLLLVMVISMSLTACLSLFTPVTYVSTVTLLSTVETQPAAVSSLGKFLGLSSFSGFSSTDVIIPLLNSRRMTKDISDRFNLDKKPKFSYSITTNELKGAFAISVKGSEPDLTKQIANFIVQNVDKINNELDITPNKPMVKVLDPAVRGIKQSRPILRKIFVAGLLSFLLISLYAFFSDYLKKLKAQ